MIELRNVSKIYSQNNKILDNINLCIGNSGMIAITGKNGCGKTTLLNIIGGVDTCTNGSIYIDNHKLEHQNIDDYRKNYVSFIFQDYNLINELNVYENIILCLKINNLKVNENDIDELLDKLKLNNLKLRKVNQLSSGQKQRVAIARALVKKPKIILADEPTCNLDYKNANNIMELLKNISNEIPVLIVTHDDNIIDEYYDNGFGTFSNLYNVGFTLNSLINELTSFRDLACFSLDIFALDALIKIFLGECAISINSSN